MDDWQKLHPPSKCTENGKKKKKKGVYFQPWRQFYKTTLTDVLSDDKFMTMSDSIKWNEPHFVITLGQKRVIYFSPSQS